MKPIEPAVKQPGTRQIVPGDTLVGPRSTKPTDDSDKDIIAVLFRVSCKEDDKCRAWPCARKKCSRHGMARAVLQRKSCCSTGNE